MGHGPGKVFATMNGLRGIAAMVVIAYHWFHGLPNGYLAVDFFYVLSGFVIAHAYENRLQNGLSLGGFLAVRLIRLYPLYFIGMAASIFVVAASFAAKGVIISAESTAFQSIPFAILMLPAPGTAELYPLNYPAWSLFYELIANIVYAASFRIWTTARIITLVIVCGVGMIVHQIIVGNLYGDGGFDWPSFWFGFMRVFFSFPAGILIYRLHVTNSYTAPRVPSFAIAVLLLAALVTSRPEIGPIDVFLVFPLLVFLSAESEPSARLLPLFATLGSASYAIYILHEPIHRIVSAVLTKLGMTVGASADMAIFALVIPICLWLDQSYDSPLRRWLTRRLADVGQPKTV